MSRPFPASAANAVNSEYAARIAFMLELAERLHSYGTTAQRLEGALMAVAQKLRLECEAWSNPTGMILSFSDPERPPGDSAAPSAAERTVSTRVIRLAPGETDLYKLCEADRIAEEVMAGTLGLAEGHAALRALERPLRWREGMLASSAAAARMLGLLTMSKDEWF
ncbi:MAG: threonine/serine exporter family protein, partial [Rhizobiales bacterium]|nr:threonine/serine exporter family protein [Rhizobacter sp.]